MNDEWTILLNDFSRILLFQNWMLFHFVLSSVEAAVRLFLSLTLICKPETQQQGRTSWSVFTKSSCDFESCESLEKRNLCSFGLATSEQFLTCRPHLSNSSAEMGISVPRNKLLWDVHGKSRKSLSLPITIWQSLSLGTCFCWSSQAVSPARGLFVYVSFLFLCLLKGQNCQLL